MLGGFEAGIFNENGLMEVSDDESLADSDCWATIVTSSSLPVPTEETGHEATGGEALRPPLMVQFLRLLVRGRQARQWVRFGEERGTESGIHHGSGKWEVCMAVVTVGYLLMAQKMV